MSEAAKRDQDWTPTHNKWLVAVVVTLGAFMEVLDTTIVNVSLPHIAGNLAVSYDDATWALTSYLLANGIVLTVSGWLSSVFGRRRYFLICIAGFTVCSFLCGVSSSLPELVIFRLLQGFFGGGLQPNQQSIILDTFPPSQRGKAFAITAVATIIAPVLGPTLGGLLTDSYGWRWVFFINVPVGVATFFAVQALVEDPPWAKARPRGIDYIGLSLITLGLGSLEFVMDRGQELDWFGSNFIVGMTIVAGLGIAGAIAWLLYTENPVVDIRVMKDRNFALGCVMIAAMACVLYASAVVIPQFAQQELGYTATWAGLILSPGGLVIIVLIPLVSQVTKIVPLKYVIAFGFFVMGCSLLYSNRLVPDLDFWSLAKMRAFQTTGLAFMFVPISTIAFATLPRTANADGSALFTMSRNYFGSLSISAATALVQNRSQVHQAYLSAHMSPLDLGYVSTMNRLQHDMLRQGQAVATTANGARNWLYQQLHTQAAVMAYSDVFLTTALLSFLLVPICLLATRKAVKGAGGGAPAH
ncbi:MAG: DHA2 family efflux MFS transporter permease subunit [Pseudomonadota bacterium]|nr:DHA2 family efflux MFS transporter permease subunit [Pseudomonadota bacterium]